jgi:Sec-independent protein translocase protein TatA
LPSLGKSVGEAIRGFKKGLAGPSEKETEKLHEPRDSSTANNMGTGASEKKKETSDV